MPPERLIILRYDVSGICTSFSPYYTILTTPSVRYSNALAPQHLLKDFCLAFSNLQIFCYFLPAVWLIFSFLFILYFLLSDGTCGSTCSSFTKIPQEAGKATFVGAGGLWGESMDVASFGGGFVCNPGYLRNIATWSGITFPQFLTNQSWQFGW